MSAYSGEYLDFYLITPPGTTNVQVKTTGGSGDADLYAAWDAHSYSQHDVCESENYGNSENCLNSLNSSIGDVLYVTVAAYRRFSNTKLQVSMS